MPCCDIFEKWKAEENLLRMYNYWIVSVRTKQPTLGSCLILLKRHAESFSEVKEEEMAEFLEIAKDLERGLKNAFDYDKINYLVLMMADKHFHFHVLPRYARERELAGIVWKDGGWPGNYITNNEEESTETLTSIKDEIQKNF